MWPHLAVATVFVLLCRPLVVSGWDRLFPQVQIPARALVDFEPEDAGLPERSESGSIQLDTDQITGFNGQQDGSHGVRLIGYQGDSVGT